MAPTRLASKAIANENVNGLGHGITTRSKQVASLKSYKDTFKLSNKRKADSPSKDGTAKRAAFGDITNALNKSCLPLADKDKMMMVKKVTVESKMLPTVKTLKQINTNIITNGKATKIKPLQRAASNALESVQKHFSKDPPKPIATRAQNGILKNFDKKDVGIKENQNKRNSGSAKSLKSDVSGEPSLYLTALENISPADSTTKEEYKTISEKLDKVALDDSLCDKSLDSETENPHQDSRRYLKSCQDHVLENADFHETTGHTNLARQPEVPQGVTDFDQENWDDPYQVSHYAMDIFNYLKNRERLFPIEDYLERLKGITTWMRSLLVDWMVEVQESFELNHETLYLAVKLVDLYLTKASKKKDKDPLTKEELQLLGASSLFIASKYDERIPPLIDDFLYICDGAYSLSQLLKMEMEILRVIDYDLGVPLSYRFLRRYARCARVSMPTLTLARFVLELSLLEYSLINISDSKMAAAALYIALKMKAIGSWTTALEYYSGYTVKDILPVAIAQNALLHKKPKSAISTVRNKYSHTIFFEVAKVPLIDDSTLTS